MFWNKKKEPIEVKAVQEVTVKPLYELLQEHFDKRNEDEFDFHSFKLPDGSQHLLFYSDILYMMETCYNQGKEDMKDKYNGSYLADKIQRVRVFPYEYGDIPYVDWESEPRYVRIDDGEQK